MDFTSEHREQYLDVIEKDIRDMLTTTGDVLMNHIKQLPDHRIQEFVNDFTAEQRKELVMSIRNTLQDHRTELQSENVPNFS